MQWDNGDFVSPLFRAALNMKSIVFLPLLLANFTSPPSSSLPVRNLLDQECKLMDANGQRKQQSLRKWATEWEEDGSWGNGAPFYEGLLPKLEDAEKGERHLHR